MMMTRMAKKSDIGGYEPARHLGTRAQGGGGRRAKPLLQSKLGRKGLKGIVERGGPPNSLVVLGAILEENGA